MIRILLADDHAIIRSGIRFMLQDAKDIAIIAEAATGEATVELTRQLKPDIVLMDINMPGTDGFSASMQLLNGTFSAKILVITNQQDGVLQNRLLQMGVLGYLSKNTDPEILKKIIRAIYAGKPFANMIPAAVTKPESLFSVLSDRELQIALMIARGMESKEIANRLFLSPKTVHGYHRDILKKLGVAKDVELARLMIRHGLIDLDNI
jgi:two-component system invasion response regulator UvrY